MEPKDERESDEKTPTADDNPPHQFVYLFLPLPWHLPLPDAYRFELTAHPDEPHASHLVVNRDDGLFAPLVGSAVVHQIPGTADMRTSAASVAAARKAFPDIEARPELDVLAEGMAATTTVVEVATPVADQSGVELGRAIRRAVHLVRMLQMAAGALLKEPVPLLTLDRLPPAMAYAYRTLQSEEESPTWPTEMLLVEGSRREFAWLDSPALDADSLRQMTGAIDRTQAGPYARFVDIKREAAVVHVDGNWTVSALLHAVAAETLLSETARIMMWEEGYEPARCAAKLGTRPISSVAKSEFHGRLGGRWSLDMDGPVATWHRDVVKLRNRIVHAAHEVSDTDAKAARLGFDALETFLVDRLIAARETYPLTLSLLLGEPALKARGLFESVARSPAASVLPDDWFDRLGLWLREVERVRIGGWVEPQAATSELAYFIYPNDETRWLVVDPEAELAGVVRPTPALAGYESTLLSQVGELPPYRGEAIVMRVLGLEDRPEPSSWQSFCELRQSVNRFPTSLLPPPEPA